MDTRELEMRLGKMWAWQAAAGRKGKKRSAVCVEVIVLPSGMRMLMPGLVMRLLWWGTWVLIKCLVALVSAIASVVGGEET
jgi:hypothetical protein